MNNIEKVILNLKIRRNGMSIIELNQICFATYQKTLIGSKVSRVKELMVPVLRYLEETNQIIVEDGIVKLNENLLNSYEK